jgi:hypothetical protein
MEGCDECGNEYHIVGAFSKNESAIEAEKYHNRKHQKVHLHSFNTNIVEIEIDEFKEIDRFHKELQKEYKNGHDKS